ncbi:hypothetical protein BBJ28_00000661 [Nothophytophthora sp. Chile5]|nr:hypothetical protein BBJ28_00000661 [Nothophytophthora sp. Chile5]
MVVHPAGNDFNFQEDGTVSCPICYEAVTPITCGFYDCEWKFEGVRASDRCLISSPWKAARGQRYHRFDADESHGSIEWESLLVVVRKVADGQLTHQESSVNSDAGDQEC